MSTTDHDRAELAKVLDGHAIVATGLGEWCCRCDPMTWQPTVTRPRHLADAVLASPWLAAHVRAKQAEAVEEVGRLIDQSGVRTDSAERWGIITALRIVRDRADRLRDGARSAEATCSCGHGRADHVNGASVCRERDRFLPCGCVCFTLRDGEGS